MSENLSSGKRKIHRQDSERRDGQPKRRRTESTERKPPVIEVWNDSCPLEFRHFFVDQGNKKTAVPCAEKPKILAPKKPDDDQTWEEEFAAQYVTIDWIVSPIKEKREEKEEVTVKFEPQQLMPWKLVKIDFDIVYAHKSYKQVNVPGGPYRDALPWPLPRTER